MYDVLHGGGLQDDRARRRWRPRLMPDPRRAAEMRRATVERAVAAALDVARVHGVECDEPRVLHDLFSLRVHLAPAPVVARVPTWIRTLRPTGPAELRRELDVVAHLHARGMPVVLPSRLLPVEVHEHDDHVITFWDLAVQIDPAPTQADCRAMLDDLHTALADFAAAPAMIPDLFDPDAWLEGATTDGLATEDEATRLRVALDAVRDFVDRVRTSNDVIHGDLHVGNLLRTSAGLLWNDLEDVCRGPRSWDLATLAAWELDPATPPEIRVAGRLRAVQAALSLIRLRPIFADTDAWNGLITHWVDQATGTGS